MNKKMNIGIINIILMTMNIVLLSQPKELYLPKNSSVSGIAFYRYNKGLITTEDTTIYQITINENNAPLLTELICRDLNDKYAPYSHYHQPFWINDTALGFVRTYYNRETAIGWHQILISDDNGKSFQSIYQIDEHYRIKKIIVQNDSIIFVGIASDIANSIDVLRIVHTKENNEFQKVYFVGDIYPVFAAIDDDLILISTLTDSICQYNFRDKSLIKSKTNLEIRDDYALFHELSKGRVGEVFGIHADGICRSYDNGINWKIVLGGKNFNKLCYENLTGWWSIQLNSDENILWRSINNGAKWSALFSIRSNFINLAVIHPNWYWIWDPLIKGKILYGQYDVSAVPDMPNNLPEQAILSPNFPNPFNSATLIQYNILRTGFVQVDIFNMNGQLIQNLNKEEQSSGWHEIKWDGKNQYGAEMASGIYIVKFSVDHYTTKTNKILLLR